MAGDRVQINTLERAASNDVNDLQSMQSRVMADWWLQMAAFRMVEFFGGPQDQYPQSVTLGLSCRGVGGSITVQPGTLGQQSFTWPAPPGPLESFFRIGNQRADVNVPVPAVPNTLMILEARVVDVITSTQVRDVFDIPSQTFVPANVTKLVERQIEYQIIQGSPTQLPAFTGDPWVPILGFVTDGAGLVPILPSAVSWDFRNDMKDVCPDDPMTIVPFINLLPEAQVFSNAAHTQPPGPSIDNRIGGNFQGRIGPWRVWLRGRLGTIPQDDVSVVSPVLDRFEHLYLAPLSANGVTVMPCLSGLGFLETTKGVLWSTEIQPDECGRDNSNVIIPVPGSVYANFLPIPPHKAVHVMSYYRESAFVPRFATQTSGGEFRTYTPTTSAMYNVASRPSGAIVAPEVLTVDLRGIIPANARFVKLSLFLGANGAVPASRARMGLRQRLAVNGVSDFIDAFTHILGGLGQVTDTNVVVNVPCHFNDGTLEGQRFEIDLVPNNGAPVIALDVSCLGWSF